MRLLVVYYSRTGNTRKVAEKIASLLGCDFDEIVDLKNRKGPFGFLGAGYSAFARKLTEIRAPDKDPSAYDLLVVGTPIWAGNITPAVRTYLTKIAPEGAPQRKYALFYTSYSSDQRKAVRDFSTLIRGDPVATLSVLHKDVRAGGFESRLQGFVDALLSSEKAG
ncbi:MAG: flavodoxin family protein [Candidatus Methanosuratincola sp.]|jgi:flavodoxin|nr:flavodoxin family protein [Candidatus Methanosuratincola sp.]